MEIKQENIIGAYNSADENGKRMLIALFGVEAVQATKTSDIRPVTDRIKTFEDACKELGEEHLFVVQYKSNEMGDVDTDLDAYLKLRIIAAALNEGWEPQFTEDEEHWYPWFTLWTEGKLSEKSDKWKADRHVISTGDYSGYWAGFALSNSSYFPSSTHASIGSRLCFKSEALATYCGTQFIDLWAAFMLTPKN